jgi:hypothetical protein
LFLSETTLDFIAKEMEFQAPHLFKEI